MRVLLVEDEKYLAKAIAEILKRNRYTVDVVYDGQDGLDYALSGIYDVLIFDIMLPKKDGLTLLKDVRSANIETPILMLSARGEIDDKVVGLDFGADDYLPKPFHYDELLARLRALLRRKDSLVQDGMLTFFDITLSPYTLTLTSEGRQVTLSLKEAQVLEMLMKNKNLVISKDQMLEKIWGYETEAGDNHVEVHVSMIRKKMKRIKSKTLIKTMRGLGYTLIDSE